MYINPVPYYYSVLVYRFGGSRGGSRFSDRFSGGGGGMRGKSSGLGDRLHKPRWDLERLPKFEKNFYHEHPVTSGRSDVSVLSHIHVRNRKCYLIYSYIAMIII